jgi:hypothetical protein
MPSFFHLLFVDPFFPDFFNNKKARHEFVLAVSEDDNLLFDQRYILFIDIQ